MKGLLKGTLVSIGRRHRTPAPVAIGAIGGSGTRIVAQLLRDAGYYLGSDLNEANDNLWFTLFFKRREILVTSQRDFQKLVNLFINRMKGSNPQPTCQEADFVRELARRRWPRHPPEWLKQRVASFLEGEGRAHELWGWKEPNTHVVIDRLLHLDSQLRYVHVTRNGLDMALSSNQSQLELWGAIFLGRNIERNARSSLAYWCAVDRRIRQIATEFQGRVMIVDFDGFCRDPRAGAGDILGFCGRSASSELIDAFVAKVIVPKTAGRFRKEDAAGFDPEHVEYVASLGYPVA